MSMRLVILESPYGGDVERNAAYARECMADSLSRMEAPMVSHLLYTQVLDDGDPDQRRYGILAGLAWGRVAEATVVYCDLGISKGMLEGIMHAQETDRPIEYRRIYDQKTASEASQQRDQGAETGSGNQE